jgi:lipid II:glycine glycyltransferase (peptidoglycan interpeptide bridge formation enzyme)
MAIRRINIESEFAAYEKLCSQKDASVFNKVEWLKIYDDQLNLYGIYNDNNELIGSFYFFNGKKYKQEFNICPPFTPHNGLFFENRAENSSNINTFNKKIIEEVSDFIHKLNSKLVVFVLPASIQETQPFTWKDITVKVKYTYHIDLSLSEDQLLANLSSEKRKSLNKAQKDVLEIEMTDDRKIVKEMIFKTFARKQISKNIKYFDRILFDFAKPGNSFSFIAKQNGKPIAATFCVYDSKDCYYLFGGYDQESRHHGAGVSCMWKSILHAKQLGLKTFDFEGSMIPEVERYFREFGGKLIPYYEISKVQFPVNLVMKP